MARMLLKLGINALAIWVAVQLNVGVTYDDSEGFVKLVLLALVLALVNGLIKPIVKFFSFPAVLLTLGAFLVLINIAMFGLLVLLSDTFGLGLDADGFGAIAVGGIIVSIVVWLGELVIPDE